jgi:hypothetical protein
MGLAGKSATIRNRADLDSLWSFPYWKMLTRVVRRHRVLAAKPVQDRFKTVYARKDLARDVLHSVFFGFVAGNKSSGENAAEPYHVNHFVRQYVNEERIEISGQVFPRGSL